jgi:hypothetical protein
MNVFKSSIKERSLREQDAQHLTRWIFYTVPWFNTKCNQFNNLGLLESFALTAVALDNSCIYAYIDSVCKNLIPKYRLDYPLETSRTMETSF